ncbi:MAG: hypothetical protein R6V21_10700 [Pelovirga sp.]
MSPTTSSITLAGASDASWRSALGLDQNSPVSDLPFSAEDITAGTETELQVVVVGDRDRVDLPLEIAASRFYANLQRRTLSGESPRKNITLLQDYLENNRERIWENSWVRFSKRRLCDHALLVWNQDILANKSNPAAGQRTDLQRFHLIGRQSEECLRIPVSYLLKLALADFLGRRGHTQARIRHIGASILDHFLSDNTSPETFSFHVEQLSPSRGMGRQVARETAKRYLLTQLLVAYANHQFGLVEDGQKVMVYFSPHPPLRQQHLNNLISDTFYRHLYMSPCLSGWNQGEEKFHYMELCHQVLSRSRLNAVAKLREAGIILNNLTVLPNMSNTSLANNGVHLSLGSRSLSHALADPRHGFNCGHEKWVGDLVCKSLEMFLPLFATTYSAAPRRLAFSDFHPELALGFLPHQLDDTHLRMLWRRWKKKADISIFGHALTPFGPPWLDRGLSRLCSLRGDLVPDFRLLDYPICFLSTEQSPAYNGLFGNQQQLLDDLSSMGIFDRQMSLYQFFKLRDYASMKFSGFEGRHHSLFPDLDRDLAGATNLQILVTALIFKYLVRDQLSHRHIPDTPIIESERRQIFFGMAVGIPTFFVHKKTRNRLLLKILRQTGKIRTSRRYPGYLRIYHHEYCLGLLRLIRQDGADLIEMFGFADLLSDLETRLRDPDKASAAGRLIGGICGGKQKDALRMTAEEFNREAECYYRTTLRHEHIRQAMDFVQADLKQAGLSSAVEGLTPQLNRLLNNQTTDDFCRRAGDDLISGRPDPQSIEQMISLVLLLEDRDRRMNMDTTDSEEIYAATASVY